MRSDGEYRRYFDLMVIGNCLSFEELFARLKSSHMITAWLAYLELRDEEEAEKYRKLFGEGN